MSLVFAHSHKFRLINGKIYSTGGLSNDVLSRYVEVFGSMIVLARIIEVDEDPTKYSKISNANIDILDYRKLSNKQIRTIIKNNEKLIVRLPSGIGSKCAKIAKKLKKSYLTEVVGCAFDAYWNHSLLGKIVAFPSYIGTRLSIMNADYLIYVTDAFLQRRYPSKGKSISLSDVHIINDESVLIERLNKIESNCGMKKIKVATIGNVAVKYKGQKYVIDALYQLNNEGYDIEYHIIGSGNSDYLKKLVVKRMVEDKVKFVGSLEHAQVFEYLKNIDIYIQPSDADAFPRVIVEAMSQACPVIGSSTGGIPELVSSEFIFKRKSVNDLIEKIKEMNSGSMTNEARINFKKSKCFDREKLDKDRNVFLDEFNQFVQK